MEETAGKRWLWRIMDFINPLRDPSLTVAAVLTFIEEAGQHDPWYLVIVIALVNWFAVRGVVWLVVNFTFASTFIARRGWWAIKHPRLAWRILDAIGHEEIVIGSLPTLSEGLLLQDGTTIMASALGAGGIQVIGELPAGTEVPVLGLPAGPMMADMAALNGSGIFAGLPSPGGYPANNGFAPQPNATFPLPNAQSTDAITQSFSQRSSAEEVRLREQLAAYERLMDDWIQFTEEKWRTISDSQLGWKPLRGRWSNWDDIFNDAYAAKTSDPMAQAAQSAGEATARRFDASRDKGSAAAAVASFMRDMMTLRSGLDILQAGLEPRSDTSMAQPAVQPLNKPFSLGGKNGSLMNPSSGGPTSRNSLIRRPMPVFVDADTDK